MEYTFLILLTFCQFSCSKFHCIRPHVVISRRNKICDILQNIDDCKEYNLLNQCARRLILYGIFGEVKSYAPNNHMSLFHMILSNLYYFMIKSFSFSNCTILYIKHQTTISVCCQCLLKKRHTYTFL